jgi:phosphate transport system protein
MTDKHFSSQYENELHVVSARLIELGCRVDDQIRQSFDALSHFDSKGAQQVLTAEAEVNALENEIDHDITSIIAKRQPAARDLRLLMAISKAAGSLERVGNEADRIAHKVLALIGGGAPGSLPLLEFSLVVEFATGLLSKALEAFAQHDLAGAIAVMKVDRLRSVEVDALIYKQVNRIIEFPRMISFCVDLISLAKSLELIVDHARHIAELVIYVEQGSDVRHTPIEQIESLLK